MILRILILLGICLNGHSQTLSPERVAKIKNATVQIKIEGTSAGSGFFIDNSGSLLTCWHVISPALWVDTVKGAIGMKKITGQLNDGRQIEFALQARFLSDSNMNISVRVYDFVLLIPILPTSTSFLKLGSYMNAKEGEEIYTSGYPLSVPYQFISKGIISTKYIDTIVVISGSGKSYKIPRNQALMDLTLNSGNSGGAIIKTGKNIEDDEVVGIADFIINPITPIYNNIISSLSDRVGNANLSGIDPVKMYMLFTEMFKSSSVGISGCISIDHVISVLRLR